MWPLDRLTRFEHARIIAARTFQIVLGAPVLIKGSKGMDAMDIAKAEFVAGKIPMTIKRPMPSGEKLPIEVQAAVKNWVKDRPEY